MITLVEALRNARAAAKIISETYEGFDTLHTHEDWHGCSHHQLMMFFDTVGEMLEIIASHMLADMGETRDKDTLKVFSPHLHSAMAQATQTVVGLYASIALSEMDVTNPELISVIWGDPDDRDAPHDWHRLPHDELCDAVSVYPHLMDKLMRAKHANSIKARGKDDYIEAARQAVLRAEKAEKENRLLRAQYGIKEQDTEQHG